MIRFEYLVYNLAFLKNDISDQVYLIYSNILYSNKSWINEFNHSQYSTAHTVLYGVTQLELFIFEDNKLNIVYIWINRKVGIYLFEEALLNLN